MSDLVTDITKKLVSCHNETLETLRANNQMTTYAEQIEPLELLALQFAAASTTSKDGFVSVINQFVSNINQAAANVANDYEALRKAKGIN